MASREANDAVVAYRDVERKRWEFERANERLQAKVADLTKQEFRDYMTMTEEINTQLALLEERKASSRWTLATWRSNFRMALNGAGWDHS